MQIHETVSRIYEVEPNDDQYFTFQEVRPRNPETGEERKSEIGFYLKDFSGEEQEVFTTIHLDEAEEMANILKELVKTLKRERNEKQY